MLLSDNESKAVWDKINESLHFHPSIKSDVIPFQIAKPYIVYDISSININAMDDVISKIFIESTRENEYLYALDWQHSDFKFHPRNKDEQQSICVNDDRYMGGSYMAYFPSYYPDGDYYFFIASDFRFGYLSHPWQKKVWIFGKELIMAFKWNADVLGFTLVEEVD